MSSENEQVSTKCLTIEQEKNDVILELKKENKRLVGELDILTSNGKNL